MTSNVVLAPAANGWRAWIDAPASARSPGAPPPLFGRETLEAASFAELVSALPVGAKGVPPEMNVALPARLLIFERLTLPSSDRQELADMVRLQLEKTLPYAVEETTSGFQIISQKQTTLEAPAPEAGGAPEAGAPQTVTESTVLVCATHNEALQAFCAPLLQGRQFPHSVTPWVMHLAAKAPPDGIACALWQEEAEVVFAIYENGVLGFVQILPSPDTILEDLPQALMSAELAGAATGFTVALLDPALAQQGETVGKLLGAPVEELSLEEPPPAPREAPVDLTLEVWRAELARRQQLRLIQARLAVAGAVYAVLLLLVCIALWVQGRRLRNVEAELAQAQPLVDTVLAQQSRWKSLAPAIDPSRFAVEMLFQVFQSLPSPEVRITQFDQSPTDFRVQGEAPDAAQAVSLEEKLKIQPSLNGYQFEAGNPILLPNDHAQFSISGKL